MHVFHHLLLLGVALQRVRQLDDAVAVGPDREGARGADDGPLDAAVLLNPGVQLVVGVDDSHYVRL